MAEHIRVLAIETDAGRFELDLERAALWLEVRGARCVLKDDTSARILLAGKFESSSSSAEVIG